MSIEIIPPGSSAVVSEHNRGHQSDRYRNHDRFAQVSRDIKDSQIDTQKNFASTVRDNKDSQIQDLQSFTVLQKEVTDGNFIAQKAVSDASFESYKQVSGVQNEMQEGMCDLQKQISDSATQTVVGFKDLTSLGYQVEGRSLLEAAKNANALAVQADKNWFALQLQAQTIAAEAAATAAACCCELKELIRADGDETRALVNDLEHDRLRDKVLATEQKLAAYYAAKAPPVMP